MRVGELAPERVGNVADGIDPESARALADPLQVGADEVVHHFGIRVVEVRQFREVRLAPKPAMQRIRRVELVRRQVLVVRAQAPGGVVDLAELWLVHGHRV